MGSPHLLPLLAVVLLAAAAPAPSAAAAAAGAIRLPSAGLAGPARACGAPADPAAYDRPVIGIVSHPGDGAGGRISNGSATSYIAASYVKFVESAGARVVPLVYNEPEERILEKLSLLNGVLFTGGSEKQGLYFETIKRVFQYVLDRNDAGEPFPLFAQCLGFELLSMIISKDNNILETFDALNQASTLQFPNYSLLEGSVFQSPKCSAAFPFGCTADAGHTAADAAAAAAAAAAAEQWWPVGVVHQLRGAADCFAAAAETIRMANERIYLEGGTCKKPRREFDPDLLKKLSTNCLVMQNHKYGISPKRFRENSALSSFFKVLTTSPDENGKVYVSTVQAHKYPITSTQWHPEKAVFEWRKPMIPHSEDAVQVTQHFANHFISQARKSTNRPPEDKVLDNLIYNYSPTFSGNLLKRCTSSPKTEADA
ncbi:hypothetical protein ACP4OV_031623 [Aristida adscensionis]